LLVYDPEPRIFTIETHINFDMFDISKEGIQCVPPIWQNQMRLKKNGM